MDSLERRKLHLQEEISQSLKRIADSLDKLFKYGFTVSTDVQNDTTIDMTEEETNND